MRVTTFTAIFLFALFSSGLVLAQAYPTKPIRIVVAWSPGGPSDTIARAIGKRMSQIVGHRVLIENKPGAGGNIGSNVVAKAAPDGYTLLHGGGYLTIGPSLYKDLPFDVQRDFAPIGLIVSTQYVLVAHPSVPAKSLSDLISLAKANPGKLNFGSAGTGSPPHLSGELLKTMAGVKVAHIPYKGAAPALVDVVAGHIDFYFCGISAAIPAVKAGQVRALAVTSKRRSSQLPHIPTVAEAALPGYDITTWFGLLAPSGTPRAIIDKLNRLIAEIVKEPEVEAYLRTQGVEPSLSTSAEFAATISEEVQRFARIVRDAGLKAK